MLYTWQIFLRLLNYVYMNNEATIGEVLEAINTLNTKVDGLDTKVNGLNTKGKDTDERIDDVLDAVNTLSSHMEERFDDVEQRMTGVEQRITRIETTMVTKDYLDDKLYDLRGDLVVLMRKEDKKVQSLVELLHSKKVISEEEAKHILSMDLFPQVSLQ